MANKISVVIEATVDKATAGINGFKKAINEADGATDKFKAGAGAAFDALKANAGVAALAAGAALIKFGGVAVDAASDLEESMNAVNVTFGDSADAIHKLGETSANSLGLSTRAFNDAAVQFSAFAKQVAGPGGNVASTINDITKRATDFASVMNLDVNEAMGIFQSALAGESEPIRKFGKDISAAAVELYAMENGLIDNKSEMTEAIKVQARYGLLMEQTADTAGDFANTSDGLANSQRRLKASLENLSAEAGKSLTPALAQVVDKMVVIVELADKMGIVFSAVGKIANTSAKSADEYEQSLNDLGYATDEVTGEQYKLSEVAAKTAADFDDFGDSVDAVNKSINRGLAQKELADETKRAEEATARHAGAIQEHNDGLQEAHEQLTDVTAAFRGLRGELSAREGFLAFQTSLDELKTKSEEAWYAASSGADNAEQAMRDAEMAQIDLKNDVIDYAEEVGNIPPQAVSEILAQIDEGKLYEAEIALANLMRPRTTTGTIIIKSAGKGPGIDPKDNPRYAGATGGIVTRPTYALIGERGPEAVVPLNTAPGASPLGAGGASINLVVNAGLGADGNAVGRQIVDVLNQYYRNGGQRPT